MAQSDWVAEARSNEWWQEQESQKVIDIIEGLVDGNLEPTAAGEEAAATYEPLVKENPPVAVAAVHNILFRAARAVGQDVGTSQRLTEFVLALQKVGDVKDSSGQTVKLNGQAVWSDLPEFSYHFREFGISKFCLDTVFLRRQKADLDPPQASSTLMIMMAIGLTKHRTY